MKYILFLIKDFFKYIIRPKHIEDNKSFKEKIIPFIIYFIFLLILNRFLLEYHGILLQKLYDHNFLIRFNFPNYYINTECISIFSVLILPITEELEIRLFLRFKIINLSVSFSILTYSIILMVASYLHFVYKGLFKDLYYSILHILILFLLSILFYLIFRKYKNKLNKFWNNKFHLIFYFSAVIFGILHIFNAEYDNFLHLSKLLFIPFIILPYVFGGLSFGFIRMKFGIIYSIILHTTYNLLTAIIFIY